MSHGVDQPARPSLEERRSEAYRIEEALASIEQAQRLVSQAQQALCRVEGMIAEWKALGALYDRVRRSWSDVNSKAERLRRSGEPPLMDVPLVFAARHGSGGPASKWPMDAAAADAGMDGPSKTPAGDRPHPLGRRQTAASAHKPLGRPAKQTAALPQRPQAPAQGDDSRATVSPDDTVSALAPGEGER